MSNIDKRISWENIFKSAIRRNRKKLKLIFVYQLK
nr:MAG TPA: hypothetical protein [Caudoviricetes sp.]DAU34696.1 MAG TPA: hypothetical protein [Caudoviricetes sp.]